tara:strand:+ start:685 stop:921 length:237 start_codon:yes stop_codon:yes gene_type:complete
MRNYKVRLYGRGIFGEHIIPCSVEPTTEYIEDAVALLLNEGLMELKSETGFHRKDRWTLTYEEVTEKEDKQLILGTWV